MMSGRLGGALNGFFGAALLVACAWGTFSFDLPRRVPETFTALEPALSPKQFYLLDRRPCRVGSWKPGQIVRFRVPGAERKGGDGDSFRAARVAAVAGETVEIRGGALLVDGVPRRWDGQTIDPTEEAPPFRVPAAHLFLLVDHAGGASHSDDARTLGAVPLHRVEGVVLPF